MGMSITIEKNYDRRVAGPYVATAVRGSKRHHLTGSMADIDAYIAKLTAIAVQNGETISADWNI